MKLINLLIIIKSVLTCKQAWNGGGTGAWYRVDTSCNYSFVYTQLINCLPTILYSSNKTLLNDGFYISLGIFNSFNGISFDIGLTFDFKKNKCFSYANDRLGWKSGNISIDSNLDPCINVSLSIIDDYIIYKIKKINNSILLGEDIYYSNQIDPLMNLTKNNSNFGFYRFDSIAQINETLKTGSQMIHAKMFHWIFKLKNETIVPPNQYYIASNVYGYQPGSCCTNQEMNTITIYQQTKWNQSDISINYTLIK